MILDDKMEHEFHDDVLRVLYVLQLEFLYLLRQRPKHVRKVKIGIKLLAVLILVVQILHTHHVHLVRLVLRVNDIR